MRPWRTIGEFSPELIRSTMRLWRNKNAISDAGIVEYAVIGRTTILDICSRLRPTLSSGIRRLLNPNGREEAFRRWVALRQARLVVPASSEERSVDTVDLRFDVTRRGSASVLGHNLRPRQMRRDLFAVFGTGAAIGRLMIVAGVDGVRPVSSAAARRPPRIKPSRLVRFGRAIREGVKGFLVDASKSNSRTIVLAAQRFGDDLGTPIPQAIVDAVTHAGGSAEIVVDALAEVGPEETAVALLWLFSLAREAVSRNVPLDRGKLTERMGSIVLPSGVMARVEAAYAADEAADEAAVAALQLMACILDDLPDEDGTSEHRAIDPAAPGRRPHVVAVVEGTVLTTTLVRHLADADRIRIVLHRKPSLTKIPEDALKRLFPNAAVVEVVHSDKVVRQYSPWESELSRVTGRIATTLTDALVRIARAGAGKAAKDESLLQDLMLGLEALSIRIDDLLFSRAVSLWGALNEALAPPTADAILFTDSARVRADFRAYAVSLGRSDRLRSVSTSASDSAEGSGASMGETEEPVSLAASVGRELLDLVDHGRQTGPRTTSTEACMIVGRHDNRNYHLDIAKFGEAMRHRRRVIFVPGIPPNLPRLVSAKVSQHVDSVFDETLTPTLGLSSDPRKLAPTLTAHLAEMVIAALPSRDEADPIFSIVADDAYQILLRYFSVELPERVITLGQIADIVVRSRPHDIVVMPGRDWIARMACLVGRRWGIPTFDVQTVFVGPRSRYIRTLADRQLAIETNAKHLFTTYFGMADHEVLLAGCSKLAGIRSGFSSTDRMAVRAKLKLGDRIFVKFAASPQIEDCAPVAQALVDFAARRRDVELGVRLHPSSDDTHHAFYRELLAGVGNARIVTGLGLAEAIAAADLVVTRFSNVGLEAAMVGKNVIACNFSDEPAAIRLDEMGVAAGVFDAAKLSETIEDILGGGPICRRLAETRDAYLTANPQLGSSTPGEDMVEIVESETLRLRETLLGSGRREVTSRCSAPACEEAPER